MKLSKETLALVKNFAGINSNILFKAGNALKTVSAQKNIMASTTVTESFPQEFGIYDLNEFLSAMSLFEDPELDFEEKYVKIRQGNQAIKFISSEATNLVIPTKEIVFPESDIDFKLTEKNLSMIQRTSSVLHGSDVSFVGDGTKLTVVVGDKKNTSKNSFEEQIGDTNKSFTINLKVDNLKMIPGDYDVSISSRKISRFKSTKGDLVYYVAVEADSTFE